MPPEQADDKSIPDNDRLLRRVRENQLIWDGSAVRPSSAVFKTEKMSVNIESLMVEQGRPLQDALSKYPGEFLTAIVAGEVRKFSLPIVKDTDPPNDPAHGLVLGKKRDSFANAMVRTHEWVVPPSDDVIE